MLILFKVGMGMLVIMGVSLIVGVVKVFLSSSIRRVVVGEALVLVWVFFSRKDLVWLSDRFWFLVLLLRKVGFDKFLE